MTDNFVLTNSKGIDVISFNLVGACEDPRITISDSSGVPRICIGLENGMPFINVLYENGSLMGGLGESASGYGFTVMSKDGSTAGVFSMNK